ncbi:hypothetical protein MYE70_18715 [Marinobacter alexandrii]|uniref:hypothetical protein n=1 Tax=Marinobacter alexandrii TaxID=2570351 RepID=UPI001FFE9B23|nr:hypothetical protein [Marinobacter alexandrii]MCK2151102.1 hypothetical protein [Marinobacter alexandrii]
MSKKFEGSKDVEGLSPGTAAPAKLRKAGCGIRFDDDELHEGIDFSGATTLLPDDSPATSSQSDPSEDR